MTLKMDKNVVDECFVVLGICDVSTLSYLNSVIPPIQETYRFFNLSNFACRLSSVKVHLSPNLHQSTIQLSNNLTQNPKKKKTYPQLTLKVVEFKPSKMFQTITVLSSAPVARNSEFGEKLRHVTAPACPSSVCVICGAFICQICMLRPVATADSCESREMSKHVAGWILAALIKARCDNDNCRNGLPFVLCLRCGGGSSLRNE